MDAKRLVEIEAEIKKNIASDARLVEELLHEVYRLNERLAHEHAYFKSIVEGYGGSVSADGSTIILPATR